MRKLVAAVVTGVLATSQVAHASHVFHAQLSRSVQLAMTKILAAESTLPVAPIAATAFDARQWAEPFKAPPAADHVAGADSARLARRRLRLEREIRTSEARLRVLRQRLDDTQYRLLGR